MNGQHLSVHFTDCPSVSLYNRWPMLCISYVFFFLSGTGEGNRQQTKEVKEWGDVHVRRGKEKEDNGLKGREHFKGELLDGLGGLKDRQAGTLTNKYKSRQTSR
mmetsp:Transcript_22374/g.44320  ORF Transcript_22374/g.44320 Transcript_22374/m.44320 type:complete len:104 (+) Transcript_22374:303-614(+)